MLSKHQLYYGLGMDALVLWFGQGCAGNRMFSKQEHYYGLGMDGLVSACSRSTDVIMVFGHGCTGKRMLSKHER